MEDERKTKKQLIQELQELRQFAAEAETLKEEIEQTRLNQEKFTKAFLQNSIPVAITTVKDGRFVDVSDAFLRLVELKREEVIGHTSRETGFITEEQRTLFYNELGKNGRIDNLEIEVRPKGKGVKYGLFNVVMISLNNESYLLTTIQDITERKQAEAVLREREANFHLLADHMKDPVWLMDLNMKTIFRSPATYKSRGYNLEDFQEPLDKNLTPASLALATEAFLEEMPRALADPTYTSVRSLDLEFYCKNGTTLWAECTFSLIHDESGTPLFLCEARDITERKLIKEVLQESKERYYELSILDGLTTLYNSRHFYVQLKIELERSNRYEQPLTLLLLDLDDFKAFNDTYGHIEGDQVLLRLGLTIKRCLRETDHAYRYGGEEFTILLPMTTSADGAVTAERIRTEFKNESFSLAPGQEVHVTVSIGLAQYKPQEDIKAFVHRADQLMYQAKNNGKDRVCS
jgi:diguanylate cyclase (GGDEF)-like protein/PAS domain S-box-containing protein